MAQDGSANKGFRTKQNESGGDSVGDFELRDTSVADKHKRPLERTDDRIQETGTSEEQVANPNIHYGSQDEPESFVAASEGDGVSRSSAEAAEIESSSPEAGEVLARAGAAGRDEAAGTEVQDSESPASPEEPVARQAFSSGSSDRPGSDPTSEPSEAASPDATSARTNDDERDSDDSDDSEVEAEDPTVNIAPEADNISVSGVTDDQLTI